MRVVVGSRNPVKVEAVRNAFSRYFKDVEVLSKEVSSGVSDMPLSLEEAKQGAVNRAKAAISDADFGVGMEGGAYETEDGLYLTGYTAIVDKNGTVGFSSSHGFVLPDSIAERLRRGEELGPIMDELTNTSNVKEKGGAFGYFTKGQVSRSIGFEHSVIFALVKFINPELYDV